MAKVLNLMSGGGGSSGSYPYNVASFSASALDDSITLTWTDPADSAWTGTMIRRKAEGYPTSETDGVLVVNSTTQNQYASVGFVDDNLEDGITYYYQAFPYSDDGYCNNEENRVSATPTYIYPSALTAFSITSGNAQATLNFTLPANAVGVKMVYKTGSYPTSQTDGTVIADASSGGTVSSYTVGGLTNDVTYYFRAFPFNSYGRYNSATTGNEVTCTPTEVTAVIGATALPVNDYVTWLQCTNYGQDGTPCPGLNPDIYANLAAVVADEDAMTELAGSANAVDYMIRSTGAIMTAVVNAALRADDTNAMTDIGLSSNAMNACIANETWAEAILGSENARDGLDASSPILVPAMTGYTAPEGTVSGSSYYIHNTYFPWQAFSQRQPSTAAMYIGSTGSPQWLAYEYADGVTVWLYKIKYKTDSHGYAQPKDIELHGSNDGFMTYDVLGTYEQAQEPGGAEHVLAVNAAAIKRYKAIRFYATTFHNPYSAYSMCICDVQFYGK